MSDILVGADGSPLVIKKDGKPIFVGKEDPSNPPVVIRDPNMRMCTFCRKNFDNSCSVCPDCGREIQDSKMQCPVCLRWFDYLLGENGNGGIQGCEAHWKPPTQPQGRGGYYGTSNEAKDIPFD